MSDDEVIGFEITEDDINNEFNFDLRRPKISKNRATYGIWAEDSDEEDAADSRPSFGVSSRGKKIRPGGNYTAPLGFVSAGLQKSRKEELEEEKTKKKDDESGEFNLNDDGSDSDAEGTYSSGLGFKSKSKRKGFGANKKLVTQPADSGQMAGFRTQGYQPPSSLGKGFGDWEKHTKGIGVKLLLKMGYQAGKGLGKELQGRSTIVEAHLRKGRGAIGAYGREGGMKEVKRVDSEEEEETEFKEKLHQWKKGDSGKTKVKYIYKSADQVLEEGKWRKVSTETAGSGNLSKVKVIDMTGKEQRVLSGYHAIGNQKMLPDEDIDTKNKQISSFDLPELRHNIDMLLDQCEENLISADRKLKYQRDKLVMLEREEEKLAPLLDREKAEIEMIENVLAAIEDIERLHQLKQLDLHTAKLKFSELRETYPKEYKMYELPYIASTVVVPLLTSEMAKWIVLDEPRRFRDEFAQWRDLLEVYPSTFSNRNEQKKNMEPFNVLLWEAFMPRLRTAIDDWNSRHPDSILQVLDSWNDLLPPWIMTNIQDSIILPKLQKEVELWNPLTDRVPIHSWLHPWLPRLGSQLEIIYPTIRNKLSSALNAWHPSDKSARLILLPWKDVFTKGSMSAFVLKNILPKLETALKDMPINPHHQRLDEWNWLMEWKEFLAPTAIVSVLEKLFFPRWLQVLAGWLNHNPNYDDVVKWYKGWKSVIPADILSTPHVVSQLTQALNMMNRVVSYSSGHPMSQQPGAVEAMAYLTAVEKDSMPSVPLPPPQVNKNILPPPPLPSLMSDIPTNEAVGLRDMVAMKCAQRGITFVPIIPQKFFEGKPIYRVGNSQIYMDRNAIFVFKGDCWMPVSLNSLLDNC